MTDKKKTIKTIALVLISVVFLFMVYNTFFKGKKNSRKTSIKTQPAKMGAILPENRISRQIDVVTRPVSETYPENTLQGSAQHFNPSIPNIFEVLAQVKPAPKEAVEVPKPISDAIKNFARIMEPQILSDQEKMNISQDLNFKGSILSSKSAVAIINNEFIHVGDSINGYKVASISEHQVFIDTGRGTIVLEIMRHE